MKNKLLLISVAFNAILCLIVGLIATAGQEVLEPKDFAESTENNKKLLDENGSFSYKYAGASNLYEAVVNPDKDEYIDEWRISAWEHSLYPGIAILYEDSTHDGKLNVLKNIVSGIGSEEKTLFWEYHKQQDGSREDIRVQLTDSTGSYSMTYDDFGMDGIFDAYMNEEGYFVLFGNTWYKINDESGDVKITVDGETFPVTFTDTKWVRKG